MAFDISYADFERLRHEQDQSAFSESGASNMPTDVSEGDWNNLSLKQKLQQMGGYVVTPNDPMWHDLAGPTGAEDGRTIQLSPQPPAYYGDPNYWVDPDKVPEIADGVYAFAQNNKTPRYQAAENEMPLAGKIILGATLGVFAAGALAAAGAAGGASSTAGIASTDAAESGGTLALNEAGTATVPYAGGVEGAAGGATAAGNYAPVSEGSTPIPGSSGAEVVDHGVSAAGTTGASGSSGGIVNGVRSGASSLSTWYNGLSPGARMVLGTAVSQGASGALAQHRQNQVLDEQQRIIDQQRQDQIRRGYIAPFDPNAFRPRGIIDGQRTGG